MGTLKPQSNGPLYSNMVIGTLAVDGWAVTFGTGYSDEGPGRAGAPPSPLIAVPNVTAYPSTPSVQSTVLLYDGLLLNRFNVAITGLTA